MPNINERPVCHRAEDLVTYLYGEASEVEAKDFTEHLQQCDACRSEFGVFQQVHDSILLWRNEALGAAFSPAAVSAESRIDSTQFVQHERRLTALAALREFFSVSPLWLRAATGFAALLLCVLSVLAISRAWNKPVQLANKEAEPKYSQQDLDQAVQKRLDEIARVNNRQTSPQVKDGSTIKKPMDDGNRTQLAVNRVQPKTPRARGLSRQEREQLASDLRLIPRDEDELPFVLSDEPNQ
ncbi:MAG TPA: zf-HC2 domain-containing protein [Pyrinomonadaceae bacterium]|nr:zf-HC2 domain-containing protein [Pyrinomonadaceae bacterium]